MCFPVVDPVTYVDSFGDARGGGRSHEGTDLMGQKGTGSSPPSPAPSSTCAVPR